eukprot:gene25265-biopygen18105
MPPHQQTALTRPALRGPARSSQPPQIAADAPRNTKKRVYIQPSVATRQSQVVVKSSAKKPTSAPQVFKPVPALDKAFAQLEDELEKLSGMIEENGAAISATASASVTQSLWTIAMAVLVATVLLVLGALWMAHLMAIPMGQAVTAAGHLADGNLTIPIALVGNDDTRQLLEAMRVMQQRISQTVSHVQDNAALVSDASAQIAQGNTDLSNRTEQQASSLEETAASMEQLRTTVRQTADHASQANALALNASQVAVEGGDVVGQ